MSRTTTSMFVAFLLCACGGESSSDGDTTGGGGSGGSTGGTAGGGGSGGSTGGATGTGGASGSGGSTGGTAGAAGTGGVAGSGGSTGGTGGSTGGTGGGGPASPECSSDSDCKIFSDCCNCIGVPTSENPAGCPALCIQDKCSELGAPTKASCVAGRCVTGFSCDSSKVTCKAATPSCSPGEVPLIAASGTCWQGSCVPAGECAKVKACADCTGDLVCASHQTQLGVENHCVDVPKVCGSNFTCACMGPSVCTPPYATCSDFSGQKGVSCSCPNC